MSTIEYREPLFRPPAEADSMIFQVAYGCPHNTCRFCGMYKGVSYRRRDLAAVLDEIGRAGERYPQERRFFLADGDVMALPAGDLACILEKMNDSFPRVARVNVYANGSSIAEKTDDELRALRALRLNTLYLGLETGLPELLDLVSKGETVERMVEAVVRAQAIGFKCSVMVLIGLGGKGLSARHAEATASALNRMQPRLLSALRFIEVPGTSMFSGYETVTEREAIVELRAMISDLELDKTVFRANHTSNPVPLSGRFPQDKTGLLEELDQQLASGRLDEVGTGRTPFYL